MAGAVREFNRGLFVKPVLYTPVFMQRLAAISPQIPCSDELNSLF
jgi:hypothetical protein